MTFEGREQAPKLAIGVATGTDLDAIRRVIREAWLVTYPNDEAGVTREDIEDRLQANQTEEKRKRALELIEDPPPGLHTLIARSGSELVAVCRIVNMAETPRGKQTGEKFNAIEMFYILPEHQRQGIGTKLWEEAKKYIDMNQETELMVAVYNENARAFYRSLGFEDTGIDLTDERFRLKSGAIIPQTKMIRPADKIQS